MTYSLYSSFFIRYFILSIFFVIALPLSIVHGEQSEFSSFFIMSSFVPCDTLYGYLERLIIVTVILVIAAIEGMCIFLL